MVEISIYTPISSINKTKLIFITLSISLSIPPYIHFSFPPTQVQEMYTNKLGIDSRSSTVLQTCKVGNIKGTGSVHVIWRAPYIVIIDLEIEI